MSKADIRLRSVSWNEADERFLRLLQEAIQFAVHKFSSQGKSISISEFVITGGTLYANVKSLKNV